VSADYRWKIEGEAGTRLRLGGEAQVRGPMSSQEKRITQLVETSAELAAQSNN
jgi:hypothetical protein